MKSSGGWFGPAGSAGFGWLASPSSGGGGSGVIVLPPVGYPYWTSHRTLRVLGERLAEHGHTVMRLDYEGTGDAAGDQFGADRFAAWLDSAREAVSFLRAGEIAEITVIGVRLGASMALMLAQELGVDRVVAWSPVIQGRRYAKEIRMLSMPVPVEFDPAGEGTRAVNGSVFTSETLQSVSAIDLTGFTQPPREVLLLDGAAAAEQLTGAWNEHGTSIEICSEPGGHTALETPTEFATVPENLVDAIVQWIDRAPSGSLPAPISLTASRLEESVGFAWRGGQVRERVLTLEPLGHVAIVSEPAGSDPGEGALVILNSGSETHIGPGRAWVELARDLAVRGHRVIRVDFLGWGESPDDGRAPGRPYDPAGVEDANAIARAVRGRFGGPVVLFGLCASAWIILESVLSPAADGVISLNPQMYWQQGDPADIDWDRIRAARQPEIDEVAAGALDGRWDRLDAEGDRPRVARWLDSIVATDTPVDFLFAEGDLGLIYLTQRFNRRLTEVLEEAHIELTELPGVDHPLHRVWARDDAFAAVRTAYERQRDIALKRAVTAGSRLRPGSPTPAV